MTTYNTDSDSANTSVRAFLTKVGEYYLGRTFNTGSGWGKQTWLEIKEKVFDSSCAYCGKKDVPLQIEHLIMFNKTQCGFHHPGNIAPACKNCNSSRNRTSSWKEHLKLVCSNNGDISLYKKRLIKIDNHISDSKYPELSAEESSAVKVIAESLYKNIKTEGEKSLNMYKKLLDNFTELS